MGNKSISLEEHERRLKEEKDNLERSYQERLNQIEKKNLMARIEEYDKKFEEANKQKIASHEEQVRRIEMMRAQQKEMEDAYIRRIEEAKNEAEKRAAEREQQKLKEKIERQQKIIAQFEEQKDSILNEECLRIKEQFIQQSNQFCLKEIQQYDRSKIEELVNSFEVSENIEFVVEEKIVKRAKEYLQGKGAYVIQHINVVLVGPCGVGKSTLINSVLELEGNLCAKEGEAEPCTMGKPKYYDNPKVNFIRIADSRGIEKSKDYGVDQVVKDVKDFVEGRLLTKDPDKYVHCIWYCLTGARFEEVERESLKTLSSIYEDNKLPIIVVYTKAMVPSIYEPIGKMVKNLNGNLEFVPVISKDIEIREEIEDEENDEENDEDSINTKKMQTKIIKKKGIKKLLNLTLQKAKKAVQSSCYTGIKNIIKEEVKDKISIKNRRMEEHINNENNKKINNFKEGMQLKQMIYSISDIICEVIKNYLYDGNRNINKDSVEKIEYFLDKFFNYSIKEYNNIFNLIIEENSDKIAKKVYELEKEINIRNESIMGFIVTENELKNEAKVKLMDELKAKAELYCLRNSAFFISEPIRKEFSNLFMNVFERCLKNDKITKVFEDCAKDMFDRLKITSKKGDNQNQKNSPEIVKY